MKKLLYNIYRYVFFFLVMLCITSPYYQQIVFASEETDNTSYYKWTITENDDLLLESPNGEWSEYYQNDCCYIYGNICGNIEKIDINDVFTDEYTPMWVWLFTHKTEHLEIDVKEFLSEDGIGNDMSFQYTSSIVLHENLNKISDNAFRGMICLKDITIYSRNVNLDNSGLGYYFTEGEEIEGEKIEDVIIRGYIGSTAETYALENDFTFIALDDENVEILDTGRCGENVYWTMYSDGTLDLSGTGATYDYTENEEHQDKTDWCDEWGFPKWYDEYQNNIENIIVNEGITRLGDLILCGSYGQIETINLPDSLEEVGYFALSPMGYIGDVTSHKINRLPEKLQVIEDGGLFGIDFEEKVVLPENIEKIGSLALNTSSKEYVLHKNTKEISPLAFGVNYNEEYTTNDDETLRKFMEEAILKKNCDSILDMFVSDSEVTVYGYKNTVSELYAFENGFTFIALDEEPIITTTITSTETDITDTSATTTTSTETYVTDASETTTTSTETDVTDTSETTTASTETDVTDTSETTTISTDEQLPQAGMPWVRTVEGLAVMLMAGGTMLIVKSRRNEG